MDQEKPLCRFTAQMGALGSRALVVFPCIPTVKQFTYSVREHQTIFIGSKERGGSTDNLTERRAKMWLKFTTLK